MKKEVVIVVPLYTSKLTLFDKISLEQLHHVLGKYPIAYVMPERMRNVNLDVHGGETVYFSDKYFVSVQSYSRLCLEPFFYEQFHDYEYMLIYQTDVFVFRDDLKKFCDMGYDYIGAPFPWIRARDMSIHYKYRVGNGGFSLRKIDAVLRILQNKKEILASYPNPEQLLNGEDFFWAYAATLKNESFHLPTENLAYKFAIEGLSDKYARKLTLKKLPFGCHGWSKKDYYTVWKKWIEYAGYSLPNVPKKYYSTYAYKSARYRLMKEYCRTRYHKYKKHSWSMKRYLYFSIVLQGIHLHIIKF